MKCHDKKNTRYRSCPNSINSRCRLSSDCRKAKPTGVSPHRCRKTVISRTDTSGQEICCLIFKGRKLSETCDLLHKAPGNTIPQGPIFARNPNSTKKTPRKQLGKYRVRESLIVFEQDSLLRTTNEKTSSNSDRNACKLVRSAIKARSGSFFGISSIGF